MSTTEINLSIAKKVLQVVDKGLVSGVGKPIPGRMCVEAAVCYAMNLPHGDRPTCVSPVLRVFKISLNDRKWSSSKARANGLRRLAIAQLGSAGLLDEKEFLRMLTELCITKIVPIALRKVANIHPQEKHIKALIEAAKDCEALKNKTAADDAARAAGAAARAAYTSARAADAAGAAGAAADAAGAAGAAADAAARAADAVRAAARAGYAAAYAGADAADAAADPARAAAYAAAYAAGAAARAAARAAAQDKILSDFAEDVVQILIKLEAPGCQWLYLTE